MDIDKKFTVCFGEYQPEDFPFPFEENNMGYQLLERKIRVSIIKALDLGYRWFMCGMSDGFDLLCADILLEIRENEKEYSGIRLIVVQPYGAYQREKKSHKAVYDCADQVVIVSPNYHKDCMLLRNDYMIENSAYLIYYSDGRAGMSPQILFMAELQELYTDNAHTNKIHLQKMTN